MINGIFACLLSSVIFVKGSCHECWDKENFAVILAAENKQLQDVVVIGYGTAKRGHISSAIETIKGSEIEDLPLGNLGAALTGRLLGVGVSGGMARPGS